MAGTISMVGLSPIGTLVLEILARKGHNVRVMDRGRIEEEDIKGSTLYFEEDITKFKVKEAKKRLTQVNAKIQMKSFHEEITTDNVFLLQSDVCIDASNQSEVNALTLDYCLKNKVPLVLLKQDAGKMTIYVLKKKLAKKDVDAILKRKDEIVMYEPQEVLAGAYFVTTSALNALDNDKTSFSITLYPSLMKPTIKAL